MADAGPVPAEEHAVALLDEAAAELRIADVEKDRVVTNVHFDVGDVEVLLLFRRAEMERPERQIVDRRIHRSVELRLRRQEAEVAERADDALGVVPFDVDVGRFDVEVEQRAAVGVTDTVQPAQTDDDVTKER